MGLFDSISSAFSGFVSAVEGVGSSIVSRLTGSGSGSPPHSSPQSSGSSDLELDGALYNTAHGGGYSRPSRPSNRAHPAVHPAEPVTGRAPGSNYAVITHPNPDAPELDGELHRIAVEDQTAEMRVPAPHFDCARTWLKGSPTAMDRASEFLSDKRLELEQDLGRIERSSSPLVRFGEGLEWSAKAVGLGAAEFGVGTAMLAKEIVTNPAKGVRDLVVGPVAFIKQVPHAASEFVRGNPLELDEMAGQVAAGYVAGGIADDVIGGPLRKVKATIEARSPDYTPPEETGVNFVPSATYEPKPVEHYISRFAGTEQTLIHMTDSDVFSRAGVGDVVRLKAFPEEAKGWRKNIDALHWYQSLPTDEGVPNAYLSYVGIGEDVETSLIPRIRFRLRPARKVAVITRDTVEYLPPEGLSLPEYQARMGMLSGRTFIPGENVFGISTERQVITPAEFEGNFARYPGTDLVKVRDLGFTHYVESRLPGFLEDTAVGRALRKLGIGQRYHRIWLTEWEKAPVEEAGELRELGGLQEVDLGRYNEEYLSSRVDVTPESILRSLFRLPRSSPRYTEEVAQPSIPSAASSLSASPSAPSGPSPSTPSAPSTPSNPSIPSAPSAPSGPSIPSTPSIPSSPPASSIPSAPSASKPSGPSKSSGPSIPSVPSAPSIPSIPSIPSTPSVPSSPSAPSHPSHPPSHPPFSHSSRPSVPSAPLIPDLLRSEGRGGRSRRGGGGDDWNLVNLYGDPLKAAAKAMDSVNRAVDRILR